MSKRIGGSILRVVRVPTAIRARYLKVQVPDVNICRARPRVASLRRVHSPVRLFGTLMQSFHLWCGKTLHSIRGGPDESQ